MDIRKKILLGDKDIVSRTVNDFYLDINLSKDNREIIPYKYDNVFDLTKFYNDERNSCRNFIVYGTVNSYICNCNNLTIKVYDSPNTSIANLLTTINTEDIVNNSMPFCNIYGKRSGKYIIKNIPANFHGYSVFLKVSSTELLPNGASVNSLISENVFEQQLIFTTLTLTGSGQKVIEKLNYGLDEAVTDCDGNVFPVNNDFDFFYNKHWINKDLEILNLKKAWVVNEDTFYCQKEPTHTWHGRVVNGPFNTGNYSYAELMEISLANNSPTGNFKPNTSNIGTVSSNGECPLPPIHSFSFDRIFTPAIGNTTITSSQNLGNDMVLYPMYNGSYDNELFDTELVSGHTISSPNTRWEFIEFIVNAQPINGNEYKFNIYQSSVVKAHYREVCPHKVTITKENSPCITPFAGNPYTISPGTKNYYSDNETLTIQAMAGFYLVKVLYTNSAGVDNVAPIYSSGKFAYISIISDTTIKITYSRLYKFGIVSNYNTGFFLLNRVGTSNSYSDILNAKTTNQYTDFHKCGDTITLDWISYPDNPDGTNTTGSGWFTYEGYILDSGGNKSVLFNSATFHNNGTAYSTVLTKYTLIHVDFTWHTA